LFGILILSMTPKIPFEVLKARIQEQAPLRTRRGFGGLPGEGSVSLWAGQLLEVLGEGRGTWAIRFLRDRKDLRAAWMTVSFLELFPMGVAQEEVALERILFLERVPERQGVDILLNILRSRLFGVVIFEKEILPRERQDVQLRKMQIVAEEAGSLMILLSEHPTPSYGISVRIETDGGGGGRVAKIKGGSTE
jgi:hypothetical protein